MPLTRWPVAAIPVAPERQQRIQRGVRKQPGVVLARDQRAEVQQDFVGLVFRGDGDILAEVFLRQILRGPIDQLGLDGLPRHQRRHDRVERHLGAQRIHLRGVHGAIVGAAREEFLPARERVLHEFPIEPRGQPLAVVAQRLRHQFIADEGAIEQAGAEDFQAFRHVALHKFALQLRAVQRC